MINGTANSSTDLPVDIPLSPITSIEVHDSNGTMVNVKNLTQPILFNPIIPQLIDTIESFASSQSCARAAVCSWFDHSTNEWSSDGCTTISVTAASTSGSGSGSGVGSSVACSCNHLTEFAILARDVGTCGTLVYNDEKMVLLLCHVYGL